MDKYVKSIIDPMHIGHKIRHDVNHGKIMEACSMTKGLYEYFGKEFCGSAYQKGILPKEIIVKGLKRALYGIDDDEPASFTPISNIFALIIKRVKNSKLPFLYVDGSKGLRHVQAFDVAAKMKHLRHLILKDKENERKKRNKKSKSGHKEPVGHDGAYRP